MNHSIKFYGTKNIGSKIAGSELITKAAASSNASDIVSVSKDVTNNKFILSALKAGSATITITGDSVSQTLNVNVASSGPQPDIMLTTLEGYNTGELKLVSNQQVPIKILGF